MNIFRMIPYGPLVTQFCAKTCGRCKEFSRLTRDQKCRDNDPRYEERKRKKRVKEFIRTKGLICHLKSSFCLDVQLSFNLDSVSLTIMRQQK